MPDLTARLSAALADRYRIERLLGEGGMATVYLAEDLKHKRKVAVKVLRPELAVVLGGERFLNEIRVTANLQHPHILQLYDSGEADSHLYYVMPFIEGESLREKLNREKQLPIDETLEITKVVASALDFAHQRNVIHRDIKPENILLQDGVALVADFGIAVAVKTAGGERLTETGLSIGTPAYMSPEQIAGQRDLDARSDVYSLACVTYEMLAGDPPFVASNAQAVMAKHVTDPAPPIATTRPSVSAPLAAALSRALNKSPVDRFDSASTFASAMSGSGGDEPARVISIVVLPFANMSPDPDNEYFADGLTDEIITDLSKLTALRVISRNSAMLLKDTKKDTRTIGRELDCQYVLEGSVRKAGRNVRISAQLIDAESDAHLWAEKYTGVMDDVFEIQENVSQAIVEALALRMSPEEEQKLEERPIENVQAYECYLRARQELWRFTPDALERAEQYFQHGLDMVGPNALMYAGLGRTCVQYWLNGIQFDDALLGQAKEWAEKCFGLTSDLAQGHVLLSLIAIFDQGGSEAIPHLKQALRLAPNDPEALAWLAMVYAERGRSTAARPLLQHVLRLDPLTPLNWTWSGYAYWMEGRFQDAVEATQKGYELGPHFHSGFFHALSLRFVDRLDEADMLMAATQQQATPFHSFLISLYRAAWRQERSKVLELCTGDNAADARRLPIWSWWVADCHALVGANDEALDWLGHAVDLGFINYPFLSEYNPFLKSIRGQPPFRELMGRVKHEWQEFDA